MSKVNQQQLRVIVSGGGTGGHIFPAIAIADELKRLYPNSEFLFVGAEGKMEMEKVPAAGYQIVGLPIRGLQRKLSLENLSFPFRLISSLWKSRSIIKQFKPDVVVGTGGYAGGPILYVAAKMGVPTLIQEPNAFAGLANKWVGKVVDKICVAFPNMEQFFPAEKLIITGNPVRESLLEKALLAPLTPQKGEPKCYHVLLMGGSGGARSLNDAMCNAALAISARPDVHWMWQCGKHYYEDFSKCASAQLENVKIAAFLNEMDAEYAKADVVIGRAGSTTIAEIQYLGKPTILVPSPWVAEDHQTMNAKALTERNAAVLVTDKDSAEQLVKTVLELIDAPEKRAELGANALAMAQTGAVTRIAGEVLRLVGLEQQERTLEGPAATAPSANASRSLAEVYFVGIGGIGMSALARYYNSRGIKVSGYDRTETELTKALVSEGINVHYTPQPEQIPGLDTAGKNILYVYTPAMPADFPELVTLKNAGIQPLKRSEVLGMISKDKKTIGIAGTHGKTTTTTLTTHLMRECGVDTSAFLGGISRNFNGNYVHGNSDWVTVEADEYDRSFLRLFPQQAVILSMDADHLDIYGDHETMLETGFKAFANQINPDGLLLVRHDLLNHFSDFKVAKVLSFSNEGKGDYQANNIRVENGLFTFDLVHPHGANINGLQLPLPGRHNVENAVAAIGMTLEAGGDAKKLAGALASFKGISRRFETVIRTDEVVVIDDYAHHPTELTVAISAARELYPNRTIRGVFQPHLFSRTNDFADGFATALDLLDEAILLPIYPAREQPMPGVTSELLLGKMKLKNKQLLTKEELLTELQTKKDGVLLMLGAGDIDALVPQVAALYEKTPAND